MLQVDNVSGYHQDLFIERIQKVLGILQSVL